MKNKFSSFPMKKKVLVATLISTALWLVLFIAFIPLACLGKVPNETSRYLSIASVFVMIWVPYILTIFKVKFDFSILIVYLVFIFLATFVGSGWSVYKMLSWYDTFIHFLSGVLIGFIGYTLISQNSKSKLEYFWLFVFVVAFAALCGIIWEIYEFTGDCISGSDMQVWQGFKGHKVLWDTMIDIICDFCGGVLAAVCSMFLEYKKRKNSASVDIETQDRKVSK